MEKIIKSSNSQKHYMLVDAVEYAQAKQQKWWRSNLIVQSGEQELGLLKKDTFWKWSFSFWKGDENLFSIQPKWKGDIELKTADGNVWKLIKKGASDNKIMLINAEGLEVLVMEKQGKWWQSRPYKVTLEDKENLPIQDEVLPLVIVSALGLLSQRFVWIIVVVMFANILTNQ
jgi:hypothetical protein